VHSTVKKRQLIVFVILPREVDDAVQQVDVFSERLCFSSLDFDPGVVCISEPVTVCSSFVGAVLFFALPPCKGQPQKDELV